MCRQRIAGNQGVTQTENGSDLIKNAPPFCYNSLIFNDLYMISKSPVLRRKRRKKPGFFVLRLLRVSSEKTILSEILRKILRFANFGDTGILREKSSDARVPDSPNGEKCALLFAKSELPVSPFRIWRKNVSYTGDPLATVITCAILVTNRLRRMP